MSLLDFVIVGAQKSGTTALAEFLSQHPDIAMSDPKEVHLFDAHDFVDTSMEQIDIKYQPAFLHAKPSQIRGEATPVYLFFPEIAGQLGRYNPALRLIVLLRNPVDRAYSHYLMEFERGNETKAFLRALMLEKKRLQQDPDPRAENSEFRQHSYRSRGLYSRQLAGLYQEFPGSQVLVIHADDLLRKHEEIIKRVFAFLQVRDDVVVQHEVVFSRGMQRRGNLVSRFLLKLSYLLEYWRIRRYVDFSIRPWVL